MRKNNLLYHFIALVTIIIWSLTFIQTKILLKYLSPEEILLDRFVIAWIIFFIIFPKIKFFSLKEELIFVFLGFSGIFGYYILENISLSLTSAINVGIIVTSAPIFTTILKITTQKTNSKKVLFSIIGFIFVIIGLLIMEIKHISKPNLGDILAILGALFFGAYSYVLGKVNSNTNSILITRKSFFWGIVFLMIFLFFKHFNFSDIKIYQNVDVWFNILFLSFFATALCFFMWKKAVSKIETKASNYIYLVPIINTLAAVFILNENITASMFISIIIILSGLFISQKFGV